MRSKLKTQVTKCYLIQVLDEDGNEVECEYIFCNRKDAEIRARELKTRVEKED